MRVLFGITALVLMACGKTGESVQDTRPAQSRVPSAADSTGAAAKASPSPNVAGQSEHRPAVLIVGTSLTAGLGLDPDEAYPAVLQRMADSAGYTVRIVNAGLSGETSAGALRRIDWLLRDTSAMVVIETGANDGLRGLDIDSTRANLVGIIAKIRGAFPRAPIVLAQMEAPPNLGVAYTTRFHAIFPAVAREQGVELLPFLLDGVAGVPRLNQPDGMHPTAEGARLVARNVWKTLAPDLARVASAATTS